MSNYNNYYPRGSQNPYNSPTQEQRPNKKVWLWILIPLLILIIGVVVFYFINSSAKTISSNEFSQGANLNLKENTEAKFMLNSQEHTIKVNSVGSNFVNLIIQSNPIKVSLKIGEEKKFDLDNDGFYDIQVRLNSISNSIPKIYIKKIHESISSSGTKENVTSSKIHESISSSGTKENVTSSKTINPDEITLDILLPKDSYKVNEEVKGNYSLKYQGEPFKGAVIYCDNRSCSEIIGMIGGIDLSNPNKTNALKITLENTFYYAGIYNYSIHVYNCQDIDDKFNTDNCGKGGWLPTDIVSSVTSLKSKSKTITVTGVNEGHFLKCTNNDDCNQTCTHCDSGSYVCAHSSDPLIDQKCVECITDFGCKEGYGCVDDVCVVKENLSPEETCSGEGKYLISEGMLCNGGDVSFHYGGGISFSCCGVQPVPVSVTNPDTIMDCYSKNLSEEFCSPEKAIEFTTTFETILESCEIS